MEFERLNALIDRKMMSRKSEWSCLASIKFWSTELRSIKFSSIELWSTQILIDRVPINLTDAWTFDRSSLVWFNYDRVLTWLIFERLSQVPFYELNIIIVGQVDEIILKWPRQLIKSQTIEPRAITIRQPRIGSGQLCSAQITTKSLS